MGDSLLGVGHGSHVRLHGRWSSQDGWVLCWSTNQSLDCLDGIHGYDVGQQMNPERKYRIALKYWRKKFREPGFAKERVKIENSATRIAGQIGVVMSHFTLFLRYVGYEVQYPITGWDIDNHGPAALALFDHRLQPVTIDNSLRRWTISFARAIGESDSECLELVREILTKKIRVHLN